MLQKLLTIAAFTAASSFATSAQWTLSGGHVGEKQFTEKTSGVYELSLPGDTIYGKFILKNGSEIRYGAPNTYVCGDVAYSLAESGDSLMMGSSIADPVLTLDTNAGTLTATGNVQPLYLCGDLVGNYWDLRVGSLPKIEYAGNGIYNASGIQLMHREFTILQYALPDDFPLYPAKLKGDSIVGYRFSATTSKKCEWGVPQPMVRSIRSKELNFIAPVYMPIIDISVNLIDVTLTATGHYNFNLENMYLIGSNAHLNNKTVKWNDAGCNNGLKMNYEAGDEQTQFTLSGVQLRPTEADDENLSSIRFVSTLGNWSDINEKYCFGAVRAADTLALTNGAIKKQIIDGGIESAPLVLPAGTYDFTVSIQPTEAPYVAATQTSTSSIDEISTESTGNKSATVEWFDINGMQISSPTKSGVYIRRQGNTSKKVYIFISPQ